jgi:transketolase
VLLMATGSEVRLIVEAYQQLKAEGIRARAISMPCWEIFEQQPAEYRESVLPSAVTARVAVEQAAMFGWETYVGRTGTVLGMKSFGASAPLKDLLQHFGFTTEHVVAAAKEQLSRKGQGR